VPAICLYLEIASKLILHTTTKLEILLIRDCSWLKCASFGLTWRLDGEIDPLIIGVLFWGAILCLLWRKQDKINLESDIFSSFFGTLLIALVLVKSISLFWVESSFLRIANDAALGLGLLASGVKVSSNTGGS